MFTGRGSVEVIAETLQCVFRECDFVDLHAQSRFVRDSIVPELAGQRGLENAVGTLINRRLDLT